MKGRLHDWWNRGVCQADTPRTKTIGSAKDEPKQRGRGSSGEPDHRAGCSTAHGHGGNDARHSGLRSGRTWQRSQGAGDHDDDEDDERRRNNIVMRELPEDALLDWLAADVYRALWNALCKKRHASKLRRIPNLDSTWGNTGTEEDELEVVLRFNSLLESILSENGGDLSTDIRQELQGIQEYVCDAEVPYLRLQAARECTSEGEMLYRQLVQVVVRLQLIRSAKWDIREHGGECDPLFGHGAPPLDLPPMSGGDVRWMR
jgi:hypothetical protein